MAGPDPEPDVAATARAASTPNTRPSRTWWRWAVVLAYLAFIFYLSEQSPLPSLPGLPSDKSEHFGAYGLMGALVVWASSGGEWRRVTFGTVAFATVFCFLYGWSDEFHQRFVPNREYDLRDLAADAAGGAVAAIALWAWGIIARGRASNA
jgi:VanZ family protein